jgi:hypothetical protein
MHYIQSDLKDSICTNLTHPIHWCTNIKFNFPLQDVEDSFVNFFLSPKRFDALI